MIRMCANNANLATSWNLHFLRKNKAIFKRASVAYRLNALTVEHQGFDRCMFKPRSAYMCESKDLFTKDQVFSPGAVVSAHNGLTIG